MPKQIDNDDLSLDEIINASVERSARWHGAQNEPWNGADWSNAVVGEIGEVAEVFAELVRAGGLSANIVKKIRRIECGIDNSEMATLKLKLGEEMADVLLYLVLLADFYDIYLPQVVRWKFNAKSIEQGFPERL